jgi:hypothetical protein
VDNGSICPRRFLTDKAKIVQLHPVWRIRLDNNLLNPTIIGIVIDIIGTRGDGKV